MEALGALAEQKGLELISFAQLDARSSSTVCIPRESGRV
jgi:hypothetical protein